MSTNNDPPVPPERPDGYYTVPVHSSYATTGTLVNYKRLRDADLKAYQIPRDPVYAYVVDVIVPNLRHAEATGTTGGVSREAWVRANAMETALRVCGFTESGEDKGYVLDSVRSTIVQMTKEKVKNLKKKDKDGASTSVATTSASQKAPAKTTEFRVLREQLREEAVAAARASAPEKAEGDQPATRDPNFLKRLNAWVAEKLEQHSPEELAALSVEVQRRNKVYQEGPTKEQQAETKGRIVEDVRYANSSLIGDGWNGHGPLVMFILTAYPDGDRLQSFATTISPDPKCPPFSSPVLDELWTSFEAWARAELDVPHSSASIPEVALEPRDADTNPSILRRALSNFIESATPAQIQRVYALATGSGPAPLAATGSGTKPDFSPAFSKSLAPPLPHPSTDDDEPDRPQNEDKGKGKARADGPGEELAAAPAKKGKGKGKTKAGSKANVIADDAPPKPTATKRKRGAETNAAAASKKAKFAVTSPRRTRNANPMPKTPTKVAKVVATGQRWGGGKYDVVEVTPDGKGEGSSGAAGEESSELSELESDE
uniref:Uncharacterized protein n=1 Tax=Mycena chlorophos TaxID=658473 RepID=A0ABQ0KV62_MYCCL|nr:predicted protein [Mycena chlorophos]